MKSSTEKRIEKIEEMQKGKNTFPFIPLELFNVMLETEIIDQTRYNELAAMERKARKDPLKLLTEQELRDLIEICEEGED